MKKHGNSGGCALIAILAWVSCWSGPAWAARGGGSETGNGGDAVICDKSPGPAVVSMLDYVEAGLLQEGYALEMGDADLDAFARVRYVLSRLAKLDPFRARVYQERADRFLEETVLQAGTILVDIPDSLHVSLLDGCGQQQVAIQQTPSLLNYYKRYVVDRELWEAMDSVQKAGLVLHEVIYIDAIQNGAEDSREVRYFNALISSSRMETLKLPEYLSLVGQLKLSQRGHTLPIDGVEYEYVFGFDAEGRVRKGRLAHPTVFQIRGMNVTIRGDVEYGPNHQVVSGALAEPAQIDVGGGKRYWVREWLHLKEDGTPARQVKLAQSATVQVEGTEYLYAPESYVAFDENGEIDPSRSALADNWVELVKRANAPPKKKPSPKSDPKRKEHFQPVSCPIGSKLVRFDISSSFASAWVRGSLDVNDPEKENGVMSIAEFDLAGKVDSQSICLPRGYWGLSLKRGKKKLALTARNSESETWAGGWGIADDSPDDSPEPQTLYVDVR